MAFLDVIEWFDNTGEEIVHRVPEHGSAETKYGSQCVVRENQAGVFFRDGKAYDVLGPGRHTLSTQNIPLLTKMLTKLVGFGETSPFRVEVVYVNLKIFNMKWGTREPVTFRDSEFGLIRLRAFGNFNMKVVEPMLFVNTFVGTMGRYQTSDIELYLKDVIVSRLNDLLGEQLDTMLNLPAIYDELGSALKVRVADDFAKYGVEMADFFVQAITPPEEVQKAIDQRSGMGVIGDMGKFLQYQAGQGLREAASAEGGGAAGTAGAGMGFGVGAGLGMMMPGMIAGAFQQGQQPPAQGGSQPQPPLATCRSCNQASPVGAKFCAHCGKEMNPSIACPGCGAAIEGSAKFCPQCGQSLAQATSCPSCKQEIPPGAKFCANCGQKLG